MKRILSIILTVILLVTLISCQKKETTPSITALDPTEATTETETKAKVETETATTAIITAIIETTAEPTASSQPPVEYKEERVEAATFEIPKKWKKVDKGNNVYFYEAVIGQAPFIMINIAALDIEVTPDQMQDPLFWQSFVEGAGGDDFEMVNISQCMFARFKFPQIIENENVLINIAATIVNNSVYSIGILYEENEPSKSYYDSILEHTVETLFIKADKIPATPTPIQTEEEMEEEEELEYYAGQYEVGADIPEGLYFFYAGEGESGYFALTKDENGDDIIINSFFHDCAYVKAKTGEYLEFSFCTAFDGDTHGPEIENILDVSSGMYLVGRDIPAGKYKLKGINSDGDGYYAVVNSRHKITSNKLFTGTTYVTVKKGQFLELSNALIISAPNN